MSQICTKSFPSATVDCSRGTEQQMKEKQRNKISQFDLGSLKKERKGIKN